MRLEKDYKEKFEDVGDKIKIYRTEKHLSQWDLGMLIDSYGYVICCYEKGRSMPSGQTMDKISKALEIEIYRFQA